MKNQLIRFLILITVFITLSGCTSKDILKPNQKIKKDDGIAVIALVDDKSIITSMSGEIGYKKVGSKDTQYLKSENDYNPFDNDFKNNNKVWGRVFAIKLPAGRYELSNWAMSNYGSKSYVIPKRVEPIYFDIKPHTVTYLGNYFFKTKFEGKNLFGYPIPNGGEVIITNQYNTDMQIAKKKYPNIKNLPTQIQVKQVSSWKQNYLN